MTRTVFVLNGPNLNLLGTREPEIYGAATLAEIEADIRAEAGALNIAADCRQSNHEGVLIDWLHEAHGIGAMGVILNPGGYTHTSVALLDAVRAIAPSVVEVHLSDPATREKFRHVSYVGEAAAFRIAGKGPAGYLEALRFLAAR